MIKCPAMKTNRQKLPFSIDRSDRRTLVAQMTDGLRKAIADGFYPVGSTIPGWKELAALCGVSERIPREATAWLADEGLIEAKRRLGTRVLARDACIWRGHVLVIAHEGAALSFYSNAMLAAMQQKLCQSGHFISRITLPKISGEQWDVRILDTILRNRFDLAITPRHQPTMKALARARTPYFVHRGAKPCGGFDIASLSYDHSTAISNFLSHCRRNRIRSVVTIGWSADQFHAVDALRKAGMSVSHLNVKCNTRHQPTILQDLIQASLDTMNHWIDRRTRFPDLVYFTDDYVATGALMAALGKGIDIPSTFRVVTLSNHGSLPVFTKSLAKLELNPFEFDEKIGTAIIDFLAGRDVPSIVSHPSVFIHGDTFPDNFNP